MKKKNRICAMLVVIMMLVTSVCAAPAIAADVEQPEAVQVESWPVLLVEYGLNIASTIVVTLIGVGGTWVMVKINKREELKNIASATDAVLHNAQITVGELEQEVVKAIKANGLKLDDEQIEALKNEVQKRTKEKLALPVTALLEAAKVDITALIAGAGEYWVGKIRA